MTGVATEIRRLVPATRDDFLGFMEGAGFADNPKWRSCYCQFLYVDHDRVVWAQRTAEENRAAACERIACSRMQGLLAYRDGAVVGWCNAAPRAMLDAFANESDPDSARSPASSSRRSIAAAASPPRCWMPPATCCASKGSPSPKPRRGRS
jgi:hypothetical protein